MRNTFLVPQDKRMAKTRSTEHVEVNGDNLAHLENEAQQKNVSHSNRKRKREEFSTVNRNSVNSKEMNEYSKRSKINVKKEKRREKAATRRLKRLEKKKNKPSRRAILFEAPTSAEQAEDPTAHLPPLPERKPFLHGYSALALLSAAAVRAMEDGLQHEYLKGVTTQCQHILLLLNEVLSITKKDKAEMKIPLEDQLITDLLRLKNCPLAQRYVEMTLWKRVAGFNNDILAIVEDTGYGADLPKNPSDHSVAVFESNSTNFKFLSFRDKYLKNALDTYEADLEKIRIGESMDEENVKFLRRCLQDSADLYANVKCWDENRDNRTNS